MLIDTANASVFLYVALISLVLVCSCSVFLACCVGVSWMMASRLIDKRVHRIVDLSHGSDFKSDSTERLLRPKFGL